MKSSSRSEPTQPACSASPVFYCIQLRISHTLRGFAGLDDRGVHILTLDDASLAFHGDAQSLSLRLHESLPQVCDRDRWNLTTYARPCPGRRLEVARGLRFHTQ